MHRSFLQSRITQGRHPQDIKRKPRLTPTIQTHYYFQSVLWCGSCGEVQVPPPQEEDTRDARVQSPKTTTRPNNCIFTPPCSITQGASRALICTSRNTTSCAVSLINVGLLYLGERIYLQTTCIQRKADALWPNICYKQTLLGNVLKYIACIYIDVYTF